MSSPAESTGRGMSMNTVTTVMAFSVSAFFVLFIFVRLLCARIHLRPGHSAAAAAVAAAHADAFPAFTVERGIRGLEPAVVTSFPTAKFGDGSRPSPAALEESQCPVCLEEYEAKDVVRVLPACGHAFHVACIDAWLRQHATCPVCRASLRANANPKRRPPASMLPPPVYCPLAAPRPVLPTPDFRQQQQLLLFPTASSSSSSDVDTLRPGSVAAAAASRLEIVVSDEPAASSAAGQCAPPHRCRDALPEQGSASDHC
uniref:RING-type E3 ubiquitin transferase n=1 Tax=Leersia perrieri TaxID=77586 RepID=A0A0D9VGL0_9ORYZ